MRTVITKELSVVKNQLHAVKRHVRLVGENLSFEIKIIKFENEPRCLNLCHTCLHGQIVIFNPRCEDPQDRRNMRSEEMKCLVGDDAWAEGDCLQFTPA